MTNRQKSWLWYILGIASIIVAAFIIQIDRDSIWLRIISLLLLLRVGLMIGSRYGELSRKDKDK